MPRTPSGGGGVVHPAAALRVPRLGCQRSPDLFERRPGRKPQLGGKPPGGVRLRGERGEFPLPPGALEDPDPFNLADGCWHCSLPEVGAPPATGHDRPAPSAPSASPEAPATARPAPSPSACCRGPAPPHATS